MVCSHVLGDHFRPDVSLESQPHHQPSSQKSEADQIAGGHAENESRLITP